MAFGTTDTLTDSKAAVATADTKIDSTQRTLAQSAWDTIASAVSAQSKTADASSDKKVVDLAFDNIYTSIHDAISNSSKASPAVEMVNPTQASEKNTATAGESPSRSAEKDAHTAGDATPKSAEKDAATASTDLHTAIRRDIDPAQHVVKPGDTLTTIAKEHLGKDATKEEIQQHVKEIAKANDIKNPDLIIDGHTLQLPGHTADGGLVTISKGGTKKTHWEDGRTRLDMPDGTGTEITTNPDGSSSSKNWGPNPKDNYTDATDKDGNTKTEYANGDLSDTDASGNEMRRNHDGTGFQKTVDASGKVTHDMHWGPSPENNYILLPQPDGSLKGTDIAGNTHTKWDNGIEKVDYTDGRGYTKTPQGDGGYTEHHWGPRPGDNFESKTTPDGKTEVSEKPADHPLDPSVDKDIEAQREKLSKTADERITDPMQRAKFQADMARFEERSKQMEQSYEKAGMTPEAAQKKANEEVIKTYEQVGRILEAPDNPTVPINAYRRKEIAEQVMSQAANPTSVDQGIHPTCNVTVVESRTYSRNPEEAAKLVADVVTTGSYTTKDGTKITLDQESLKPHDGAKTNPPTDGSRSYASQLFQVTAINVSYAQSGSDYHYEQRDADPTIRNDDGGRQVDWSTDPHEVRTYSELQKKLGGKDDSDFRVPGLSDEDIAKGANKINDETGNAWYLAKKEHAGGDVSQIESERQLVDQIKDAKEHGKLPIVVKVHTGNEPFYTDSGAGAAGGSGGWHVVTITDYQDGPPAKVSFDNQWGSKVDHNSPSSQISVHDLYHAMHDPNDKEAIKDLQKDVDDGHAAGHVDHYKEAESIRQQHAAGKLSDEEYQQKLAQAVNDAQADWNAQKAAGTFNQNDEFVKTWVKLQDQVKALPADKRMEIMHAEKNNGFFTSDAIADANIQNAMIEIIKNEKQDAAAGNLTVDKAAQYVRAVAEFRSMMEELPEDRRNKIMEQVRLAQNERSAA